MEGQAERGTLWHGGDLGEARRLFPDAPEPWIDLSTGINPHPYPLPEIPPDAFTRLPAPRDTTALEAAAARAYGALDPATVVAAPGTQALIEVLPRLRPPSRVLVLGPTYAEHAHAWRKGEHRVVEGDLADVAEADVVVAVNPNNPDGRVLDRATLLALADDLAYRDGWLVLDEAFADLEPVESLIPELPANAIVLRSFGKTYGLAGLRLGFAVAAPAMAEALRRALGPWAVSGPAIAVGRQALADRVWLAETATARASDAARLDRLLAPSVGRIVGGTCLFSCIEDDHAVDLFGRLGRHGIWVRRFQHDPRRLRFGLPADEAAWSRLAAALESSPAQR